MLGELRQQLTDYSHFTEADLHCLVGLDLYHYHHNQLSPSLDSFLDQHYFSTHKDHPSV